MQANRVLIHNDVFFYKDKAPFVKAGKSVLGALEYDPRRDAVKCHICGMYKKHLGFHIWQEHKQRARIYKVKFGLCQSTALVGEKTRKQMIAKMLQARKEGKMCARPPVKYTPTVLGEFRHPSSYEETRNASRRCSAQLLARIREIAKKVGHTPKQKELLAAGVQIHTLKLRFGSVMAAMELCKLKPRKNSEGRPLGSKGPQRYSDAELLRYLKVFKEKTGSRPTDSDFRRGGLPSKPTYVIRFGSFQSALKLAGVV